MAGVSGFDEKLGFFDDAVGLIAGVVFWRRIMAPEQILRELVTCIPITQQSGVVESPPEFAHYGIRIIRDIQELSFDE